MMLELIISSSTSCSPVPMDRLHGILASFEQSLSLKLQRNRTRRKKIYRIRKEHNRKRMKITNKQTNKKKHRGLRFI